MTDDTTIRPLWDRDGVAIDEEIARFTIGDDRQIDAHLARQDVLGSLAHVAVIHAAGLLSDDDATALRSALRELYTEAEAGTLRPGPSDEDIHSTLERRLTERLGEPGKRVHVARSRNDQVATDVALWLRESMLSAHAEALALAQALTAFAKAHADADLPGMTHLQPAMPSSFGVWAAGYGSLFLDDAAMIRAAFAHSNACPLGSAAGYGVPRSHAPIDRTIAAQALAFARVVEPVTAVQGGRGKPEASALFAMTQVMITAARLARDLVLYVHPDFGYISLPSNAVTGSSIMPQKKNPDVLELVRARAQGVQATLFEVSALAGSVPGGYHRDFQLLKAPMMRGINTARSVLRILTQLLPNITVQRERAHAACRPELYATEYALSLVAQGLPFRDAYRQVARAVEDGQVFQASEHSRPALGDTFTQLVDRQSDAHAWQDHHTQRIHNAYQALLADQ